MNKFVDLFDNINVVNCSLLQNIKWNEGLYAYCTELLNSHLDNNNENQSININKSVCELLHDNFRCIHMIVSGLFDLSVSTTMIFLDKQFFTSLIKKNYYCGAVSCISQNNKFYFLILLAEKICENVNELSLENPIFNYVGYKDEIFKAYVVRREERRNFMRFLLKDGTIIEEYINY